MKCAIIGLGVIGKVHISVLKELGTEIVAVCDCDEEKLKPILYRDMSYSQIKDLLDYEVYSIDIENEYDEPYFKITYCDPHGEWK